MTGITEKGKGGGDAKRKIFTDGALEGRKHRSQRNITLFWKKKSSLTKLGGDCAEHCHWS